MPYWVESEENSRLNMCLWYNFRSCELFSLTWSSFSHSEGSWIWGTMLHCLLCSINRCMFLISWQNVVEISYQGFLFSLIKLCPGNSCWHIDHGKHCFPSIVFLNAHNNILQQNFQISPLALAAASSSHTICLNFVVLSKQGLVYRRPPHGVSWSPVSFFMWSAWQ